MASASSNDESIISGINVTPLVDIVLVLLVILMVTASYVTSQAIPLDLPNAATGGETPTTLAVSIDHAGQLYLDAQPVSRTELRTRIAAARDANPETRATIAADGRVAHALVVEVMDLLRSEQIVKFAINVDRPTEGS